MTRFDTLKPSSLQFTQCCCTAYQIHPIKVATRAILNKSEIISPHYQISISPGGPGELLAVILSGATTTTDGAAETSKHSKDYLERYKLCTASLSGSSCTGFELHKRGHKWLSVGLGPLNTVCMQMP